MRVTVRSGWGIERKSLALIGEIEEFQENTRGTSGLPIGLGRSYGDSSLTHRTNGSATRCRIVYTIMWPHHPQDRMEAGTLKARTDARKTEWTLKKFCSQTLTIKIVVGIFTDPWKVNSPKFFAARFPFSKICPTTIVSKAYTSPAPMFIRNALFFNNETPLITRLKLTLKV
jgi:hypothetical protein